MIEFYFNPNRLCHFFNFALVLRNCDLIPSSFWQFEVEDTDTVYWCKIFKTSLKEKHHMIGVSKYTAMQILANRFLK